MRYSRFVPVTVLAVLVSALVGGLLRPIARDPELKLIRVCKEDECIGIASGLSYCDKRALTLIQHTGFLDSSTPSAASRSSTANRSA